MSTLITALALLTCQSPQPPSTLPLQGTPRDDDGPSRAHFTPDGRRLIVQHDLESGICSVTELDLVSGVTTARSADYEEANSIAVSPDGRIALVPEEYSGRLRVLSLPGLQLLGSVAITVPGNAHLYATVDSTSTRAILNLDYGPQMWVVNLVSMTQERVITAPGGPTGHALAADDVSVPLADASSIYTLDISTGLESARTTFSMPGTARAIALNGNGTECVVVTHDPTSGVSSLERFAVPGLASLGGIVLSAPVAQLTYNPSGSAQLDQSGDMLLLATVNGPVVVDVATGVVRPMPGDTNTTVLDPTGRRVMGSEGAGLVVGDAGTGAVLGRFPARGADSFTRWIEFAPNGRFAALTRLGSDRVEVFDVGGAAPARWRDLSSGFGEEADGPYVLAFASDGTRVAVVGRDSDDLRMIALDTPLSVAGRMTLDRGPEAIALRADGKALVAHGRGASLSVVDLEQHVELARFPLPLPAYAVVPADPSSAWLQLEGPTTRSLVRVDTTTGALLQSIVLPGGAGTMAYGQELLAVVLFDLPRARAFVASPDSGELALVDLTAGAVIATVPVTTNMEPAELALRADGTIVYHRGSKSDVSAFDVSAAGLTPRWNYACSTPAPYLNRRATFALVDSERSVLASITGTGCVTWWVVLDASSGAVQSAAFLPETAEWIVAFEDEVWVDSADTSRLLRYRASGGGLVATGEEVSSTNCCSFPARFPALGRTVAMTASPQYYAPQDRFLWLDLVQDTALCTPGTPNATGSVAMLRVDGHGFAGAPLVLTVDGLQPNAMPGYLLVGSAAVSPTPLPGGLGSLCLGGMLGRYRNQIQLADASGRQRYEVDTQQIPLGTGPAAVQAGSTWTFQVWYRDVAPGGAAASNTSTARTVRFD